MSSAFPASASANLLDNNADAVVKLHADEHDPTTLNRAPAHDVSDDDDEGMRRITQPCLCCGGVLDDAKRRSKHCGADYTTAIRQWQKVLSSALFMFFATFFSTVALGALIQKKTGQRIGLVEYLL